MRLFFVWEIKQEVRDPAINVAGNKHLAESTAGGDLGASRILSDRR